MTTEHTKSLAELVARTHQVVAHAWVVRAFVRHSAEAEDFPELQEIGRAIFDLARALETRADDPAGLLRMLGKKLSKFKLAVNQFVSEVPGISTHTNFAMAAVSMRACVEDFERILAAARTSLLPAVLPAETDPAVDSVEQATDDH